MRAATCETLIGLLAVTGMRIGEAINLDRVDLDAAEGVLVVRSAKFATSREVALHPTTQAALQAYEGVRDRRCPHPRDLAFFLSLAGTRLIYRDVHRAFHRLVAQAGIPARSPLCRPRIHDYADLRVMPTSLRSPWSVGVGALKLSA